MYYVSKRMEIAASHFLRLDYDSPCGRLHGHNYIVTVHCKANRLNKNGMVVDFAKVKQEIHGHLDHQYLNDVLPTDLNPTAENMAKWICDRVTDLCSTGYCYRVEVQESEGNVAVYERGEDE